MICQDFICATPTAGQKTAHGITDLVPPPRDPDHDQLPLPAGSRATEPQSFWQNTGAAPSD